MDGKSEQLSWVQELTSGSSRFREFRHLAGWTLEHTTRAGQGSRHNFVNLNGNVTRDEQNRPWSAFAEIGVIRGCLQSPRKRFTQRRGAGVNYA